MSLSGSRHSQLVGLRLQIILFLLEAQSLLQVNGVPALSSVSHYVVVGIWGRLSQYLRQAWLLITRKQSELRIVVRVQRRSQRQTAVWRADHKRQLLSFVHEDTSGQASRIHLVDALAALFLLEL